MKSCDDCFHCDVCPKEHYPTDMNPVYIDYSTRQDVNESCFDFKDKAKIIELPCAPGDKLYDARTNYHDYIRTDIVREFEVCCVDYVIVPWETWSVKDVHSYEFGKTVFSTKEEAEKKLAENKLRRYDNDL